MYILGRRLALRTTVFGIRACAKPNVCLYPAKRFMTTGIEDAGEQPGEERQQQSGRIHILGVGNVGTFVAHSLASRPSPPPITLLLQDPYVYRNWIDRKQAIAVQRDGLDSIKTGFDVNVLNHKTWYSLPDWAQDGETEGTHSHLDRKGRATKIEEAWTESVEENGRIDCLIITSKAPQTVKAVTSVKHRLTRDSTILFLQNGMGVIDEVNSKVFPLAETRPHYITGIISHALMNKGPFHTEHKGLGTTIVGPVPKSQGTAAQQTDMAPTSKYLLRTINLTQQLIATTETPTSILQYQLEKLAVNCVINPLTAILGCQNGEILYNYSFTRIMRMILIEISSVICALPELKGVPGVEDRFSAERLRRLAVQLANKTAKNRSSMLQDIESGRYLEIEYMNGYIVRRGEELGIKCAVNYMIQHMALGKHAVVRQRERGAIPVDLSGPSN